jgi:putative membrane protein
MRDAEFPFRSNRANRLRSNNWMALRLMNLGKLLGTLITAFVVFSPELAAQVHMDTGSQKMMKQADVNFANVAAQSGEAEVELGRLAVQKAADPDVKTFAQRMIDDHSKANDQLKQIATQQHMTLPTSIDQKDLVRKDKLQRLSGPKFDKEYMKSQVKDHEENVKLFKKEADEGAVPAFKNFAAETLPILQSHLEMAKSTDAKVK